jgi:CDP-diacylglycerol--glycerol-3-phosphate 3-phosphatidyltransferase
MTDVRQGSGVINVPNALTVGRLLCVPLMLFLLLLDGGTHPIARDLAAAVFVLASVTDFLDGRLARRRGQVTQVGRILDPIADKALVGAALIGLSVLGQLAWWITIVIMVRELLVTAVRFTHQGLAVSPGGKAKTVAQIIAITMYLISLPGIAWWPTAAAVTMAIAVVLTVVTGLDYLRRAWWT